jgi:hypothetical protein
MRMGAPAEWDATVPLGLGVAFAPTAALFLARASLATAFLFLAFLSGLFSTFFLFPLAFFVLPEHGWINFGIGKLRHLLVEALAFFERTLHGLDHLLLFE